MIPPFEFPVSPSSNLRQLKAAMSRISAARTLSDLVQLTDRFDCKNLVTIDNDGRDGETDSKLPSRPMSNKLIRGRTIPCGSNRKPTASNPNTSERACTDGVES